MNQGKSWNSQKAENANAAQSAAQKNARADTRDGGELNSRKDPNPKQVRVFVAGGE
jgi:hypothetical protein